jgi:hypothetical protein
MIVWDLSDQNSSRPSEEQGTKKNYLFDWKDFPGLLAGHKGIEGHLRLTEKMLCE